MKGLSEVTDKIKAIAAELDRLGLQAWPARADSKAPARDGWRNHEGWTPPDDLQFNGTYGILMGERSGNMEMLEIEGRAVNDGTAEDFFERLNDAGLGDLWAEIETGMQVFSPSGGAHYYYRVDGEPAGNTKLAFDENPDRPETLIETRGEGGFVVGPGSVTADGREWKLASGCHPRQIPTITEEQRDAIFEVARSLDRRVRRSPETPVDSRLTAGNSGDDLRDWVTQEIGVAELLEGMGWTLEGGNGAGGALWTRPGKEPGEGTSGELKADGCFYVYSTTAQAAWRGELFEGDFPWATPIGVLAAARFDGQIDKAMSWVRSQIAATTATPERGDPDSPPQGDWEPMDLAALQASMRDGTYERIVPTVGALAGTDHGLIYPGQVNTLYGPAGQGKTWVSFGLVADELRKGATVLVVDYEGGPAVTMERLVLDLGLTAEQMGRLDYVNPSSSLLTAVANGSVGSKPYDLILLDSVGEAMAMEPDMSSNDDGDVAGWIGRGVKLMQKVCGDATVLLIDHTTKAGETKGPIGSQRKLATVTGIAWKLRPGQGFQQGTAGHVFLDCEKDRVGALGNTTVRVQIDASKSPTTVTAGTVVKDVADGIGPEGAKPELVERIEKHLRQFWDINERTYVPQPRSEVAHDVVGRKQDLVKAVAWMIDQGKLVVTPGVAENGTPRELVSLPIVGDDFFE